MSKEEDNFKSVDLKSVDVVDDLNDITLDPLNED
jgi:hypothetical protein